MAYYEYKCNNEKCTVTEVLISKPMSASSREETCDKCSSVMERVFNIAGHQTFGDGYKG